MTPAKVTVTLTTAQLATIYSWANYLKFSGEKDHGWQRADSDVLRLLKKQHQSTVKS